MSRRRAAPEIKRTEITFSQQETSSDYVWREVLLNRKITPKEHAVMRQLQLSFVSTLQICKIMYTILHPALAQHDNAIVIRSSARRERFTCNLSQANDFLDCFRSVCHAVTSSHRHTQAFNCPSCDTSRQAPFDYLLFCFRSTAYFFFFFMPLSFETGRGVAFYRIVECVYLSAECRRALAQYVSNMHKLKADIKQRFDDVLASLKCSYVRIGVFAVRRLAEAAQIDVRLNDVHLI